MSNDSIIFHYFRELLDEHGVHQLGVCVSGEEERQLRLVLKVSAVNLSDGCCIRANGDYTRCKIIDLVLSCSFDQGQ